jgi:hypothetical protein
MERPEVDYGDEETIVSTHETDAAGLAGEARNDRALHVHFDDSDDDAWFSADLVQFAGYGEGTVIQIGDKTLRRNADGSWAPA